MESVTGLYNQVEEKLHTLVMRSNESLQHLESLLRLRETEAKIHTVGSTNCSGCKTQHQGPVMSLAGRSNFTTNTISHRAGRTNLETHSFIIVLVVTQARTWFSAEGEPRLKDSHTTGDPLVCTETAMQHFEEFLAEAKVLFCFCFFVFVFY